MKYLSVCSGIEAATVAWRPLGWTAAGYADIDAFPSAVLAHHYPETVNYGDVTAFASWPDLEPDVLVGGTPCQSFSVAGLRKGLDDPRGSLLLTYLAIARRYRPRWVVWENVPGVLSADDGRAFGSLLGGLAILRYGFAYRVLDAQYFGLAQRRKRVFVVGHLGDWRRAAAVLFERESLSGHPAPRRETGERVAGTVGSGPPFSRTGNSRVESEAVVVAPPIPARTRVAGGLGTDFNCDGGLITGAVSAKWSKGTGGQAGDECYNLIAFADVADPVAANQANTYTREGANDFRLSNVALAARRVRRLTPRECERLMGFPDDYTLIPYRGKPAADGPRYKALGNSMAVPCMAWIGQRIQMVDEL